MIREIVHQHTVLKKIRHLSHNQIRKLNRPMERTVKMMGQVHQKRSKRVEKRSFSKLKYFRVL